MTATIADEIAAGRTYPHRDALARAAHGSAVTLLRELRSFWIAAAAGYLTLVEAGCTDAAHDVAQALANADHYAPAA